MKLVVATDNMGKFVEFQRILEPLGFDLQTRSQAGLTGLVEETGTSFAENAEIKARAVYQALGLPAVADDSGLEVEALGGRPGIYSARYAGENGKGADSAANNQKLLRELEGISNRRCRYVCAICFIAPDGRTHTIQEVCQGEIARELDGRHGFGYDPLFLYEGTSFGQMTPQQKDAVSHRGKALRAFAKQIRSWI